MKNKIVLAGMGLLIIICLALSLVSFLSTKKIGYIRSYVLVERFQGTLEARKNFEMKKATLLANVDSLQLLWEQSKQQYFGKAKLLSSSQRAAQEQELGTRHEQLVQYAQAIEQKVKEEDQQMMQAVLNQINSFIEQYGRENGYDLIVGTTTDGSVLYGRENLDITLDVLERINTNYSGK